MSKIKKIWNKVKENFLVYFVNSFGVLFCVCAIGIVSWVIHAAVSGEPLGFSSSADSGESPGFPFVAIAGFLATMAGVLVALGGQFFVYGSRLSDKKEQRSRYYLDACVFAHEEAWKILKKDGTNKDTDWVQAATVLWNASIFEKHITEEPHRLVLEARLIKYRYAFSEILEKPGIFFCGVSPHVLEKIKNSDKKKMFDDAKAQMWKIAKVRTPYVDPLPDSGVNPIAEEALYAVRAAAQFPYEKLEDHPIYGLRFSEDEMTVMYFREEGIYEYLRRFYPESERKKHGKNFKL